jgi:hypothetical protein
MRQHSANVQPQKEVKMTRRLVVNCLGFAGLAILTACSGSTPPTVSQPLALFDANASKSALLYVSDTPKYTVSIYNYPADTLSATLTGQDFSGECVDRAGHVYIVLESARETDEYARGGTKPIARFKAPGPGYEWPVSCSVDPTTGNLAVANLIAGNGKVPGPGSISVYQPGEKRPAKFQASNMYAYYFLGYDNSGNLFVDGSASRAAIEFRYAELPKGQTQMTPIVLEGGTVAFPGNVQWDGKHITIGDQDNAVIYQTKGARIIGSTPLTGSSDVVGYFIDGATVICPDSGNGTVEFYKYPAGGTAIGSISGFDRPVAAAVSP